MSDITPLPVPPKPTAPFNYAVLDPALAADAQRIATRIRTRLRNGYIATGQDLLGMKERLGHGRFGQWLSAEFAMSERTAQRYMGAAQLAAANSDIVSDLPIMVVEALAAPSLPESARAVCVDRLRAGVSMTPRDVALVASEVRGSLREDARVLKAAPRGKDARAAFQARQEAARARTEADSNRAMLARQQVVGLLADALGDRRAEAAQLLRTMRGYYITPDDLLGAIDRLGASA